MNKKQPKNKTTTRHSSETPNRQVFADHVSEIRRRISLVVIIFLAASAAAYPFYHQIVDVLFAPLNGQELVYLTPIGGFSFIIKVCTYVGALVAVPALLYHCYKFLQPIMKRRPTGATRYLIFSVFLACCGIAFAYFVLLPAALRFLTTIDIQNVSAMLTVDAYLSFVIAYIIGAALMFQIPVIVLLLNNISRIPPGSLMRFQRFVILGAFITAAILSPTPDVINQTLMAAPMIIMYQLAIVLILIVNRKRSAPAPATATASPSVLRGIAELAQEGKGLFVPEPIPRVAPITRLTSPKSVSTDGYLRSARTKTRKPDFEHTHEGRDTTQRIAVRYVPSFSSRTVDGLFVPQTSQGPWRFGAGQY